MDVPSLNIYIGRTAKGGGLKPGSPKPKKIKKKKIFVNTLMTNIFRDLPFSQNRTLKSADDKYIGILTN
jgi:hypothetical protein